MSSRKGELWRSEIAERIVDYLDLRISGAELTDWAVDHPFYDDLSDLDDEEKRLIALGLGLALQLDDSEPEGMRTTAGQLRDAASALWASRTQSGG
jgi:hypothetical protein